MIAQINVLILFFLVIFTAFTGWIENKEGNKDIAFIHWMIAAVFFYIAMINIDIIMIKQ